MQGRVQHPFCQVEGMHSQWRPMHPTHWFTPLDKMRQDMGRTVQCTSSIPLIQSLFEHALALEGPLPCHSRRWRCC